MDDLVSPLRVASILDPALDLSAMDGQGYTSTRDPDLVRVRPGMTPVWAVLRPLTPVDFAQIDTFSADSGKLLMAFRMACLAVENLNGPGLAEQPASSVRVNGVERKTWGDEELSAVARKVGMRFVYEMGHVAYERALLGNDWGGGAFYTPPQFLVDGLDRRRRHPVEPSQAGAGTNSSVKSQGGPTPAPDATSGAPGAASAESGAGASSAP